MSFVLTGRFGHRMPPEAATRPTRAVYERKAQNASVEWSILIIFRLMMSLLLPLCISPFLDYSYIECVKEKTALIFEEDSQGRTFPRVHVTMLF